MNAASPIGWRGRKHTVEDLVLGHAIWVPVSPKSDHDQTLFFGHDGLIHVPSRDQMGKNDGAHVDWMNLSHSSIIYDCWRRAGLLTHLIKGDR